MFVIFRKKTAFDTVQFNGVKSITFDGTNYTVTKSDDTTATYSAADWYMWSVN